MWFNKKEEPKEEPITDWEPRHGKWRKVWVCHCGCYMQEECYGKIFKYDLCPKCGCEKSAESKICREEWEVSNVLRQRYSRQFRFMPIDKWTGTRNVKIVEWTPDCCDHAKKAEE